MIMMFGCICLVPRVAKCIPAMYYSHHYYDYENMQTHYYISDIIKYIPAALSHQQRVHFVIVVAVGVARRR